MITAILAAVLASPSFGLVVGHNGAIGDGRADLRYADDDAARMYEVLTAAGVQATLLTTFDADSQQVFGDLMDTAIAPTPAAFERAARDLAAQVQAAVDRGEKPQVFFFYSGHGNVEGGQGYVGLAGGRLTRDALWRQVIQGVAADRLHVIVDACKSYFMVGGRGPGGRAVAYDRPFAGPEAPPGVGFILSTSSDAESHEWAALPGGVFSHEVRSALVGGADANADGAVDYEELAAFVGLANQSVPLPRFRPRVFVRPPQADRQAVLLRPKAMPGTTALTLPPEAAGRLSLMDDRGLRYLDANKAAQAPLTLALLAPRRYEVRWGGQQLELQADGAPHTLADARPSPRTVAARSEAHRAFEHLFGQGFGPAVVDGYRVGVQAAEPVVPPARERDWITPGLVGGGTALLATAGVLGYLALDAQVEAGQAAQADRADLNARTRTLGWSAAGVGVVAVGALTAALYRTLTAP